MLTTGEQRELRYIEEELRDTDRGFAWRLTLVQGVLRWAAPGRQGCLLILAALAAALARFAVAAERLLKELARGAVLLEPTILVFLGGAAWPDWESEQPPGQGVSQAQAGRSPTGQTRHEHTGKHRWLPGGSRHRGGAAPGPARPAQAARPLRRSRRERAGTAGRIGLTVSLTDVYTIPLVQNLRRWWCTSPTGELGRRGKGQMTMGWPAARLARADDEDDGL